MKIYLVKVDTEDTEEYFYALDYKPTDKECKKLFFSNEANRENYDPKDWHNTIGCGVKELEIISKTK